MKNAWVRMICAAASVAGGLIIAQESMAQECPCFRYNGASIHENFTEYSATNTCPSRVNFLSRAGEFGTTQLFEKGESRTWRCEGRRNICGELTWQRVENCPDSTTQESPQPRRSGR